MTEQQNKMNQNSPLTRTEMEATLVAKAWQDDSFRQELLSNPRSVLEREFGQTVSESTNLQVIEESNDTYYIVIPKKPNIEELSEEELEAVAGGWCKPDNITVSACCVSVGWDL